MSSRKKIIRYLQVKNTATTFEISQALSTTAANARHHLSILYDEGVIDIIGVHPPRYRGRPSFIYALSHQIQSHNLARLASAMLAEYIANLPERKQAEKLNLIARRLYADDSPIKGSLTQKLLIGVQRLNEMHYQTRWEARAEAPNIIFEHCPYYLILPEHPELCRLDAILLEDMLNTPVLQTAKLDKDPRGTTICRFVLGKSK